MKLTDWLLERLRYLRDVFSDPETPGYDAWAREQRRRVREGRST